jgi:two-component system NtrC family sensor kinase
MKSIQALILVFLGGIAYCNGQDSTLLLTPTLYDKDTLEIYISEMKGWVFKQGNDTSWARKEVDQIGWKPLMPTELTEDLADKSGRVEGWFRIKLKLDSSMEETPYGIRISTWAASDLYIDGDRTASFGNTGINGAPYRENRYISNLLPVPVNLKPGKEYTLALHVVDYLSPFPPHELKAKELGLRSLIRITAPKYYATIYTDITSGLHMTIVLTMISTVLTLLFWLLSFQNPAESNLRLFALASSFLTISMIGNTLAHSRGVSYGGISYEWLWICQFISGTFLITLFASAPFVLATIFSRKVPRLLAGICLAFPFVYVANGALQALNQQIDLALGVAFFLSTIVASIYYVISSWKTLKGAQWAIVGGLIFMLTMASLMIVLQILQLEIANSILLGAALLLAFPTSLMAYVAIRFKEIVNEVKENASQVVQMSEEKKEQALNQQRLLQEEVTRQTAEIRTTLEDLKTTQRQLIQSEKMASLGELTAGIAHEIQNPLNFVNNFSEVNSELISELKEAATKGNLDEVKSIANTLEENESKIVSHGKRADAIVKGMLQHSRKSNGQKELTDINELCDEYLRLAYHGLRAKDKSFNAKFETHLDPALPKINVVPQEIGRVVLNLINNAFYACTERSRIGVSEKLKANSQKPIATYEPTVTVSSKAIGNRIEIRVKDNGPGIPDSIKDKIFQPFFTTKPTGQGTGLGLSLSYDIVKAHGGEVNVATKENEGTEFIIQLPIN